MEKYTVSQISEKLLISKDTLRYYDKLGLVTPTRGENNYRFYTGQDILDLMYIQVMKAAGLSLGDIGRIFDNKRSMDDSRKEGTILLLQEKKKESESKLQFLYMIIELLRISIDRLENKKDVQDIDSLVLDIYKSISIEYLK